MVVAGHALPDGHPDISERNTIGKGCNIRLISGMKYSRWKPAGLVGTVGGIHKQSGKIAVPHWIAGTKSISDVLTKQNVIMRWKLNGIMKIGMLDTGILEDTKCIRFDEGLNTYQYSLSNSNIFLR